MGKHFGGIHPSRSKDNARLVLAGGSVFILLFSFLAYGLLSSTSDSKETARVTVIEDKDSVKMVEVLVPVQEIPANTALEPRMFRKEPRPQIGVSSRTIADFSEIRGHYSRSLIVSGQPLHRDYISSVRPSSPIETGIPDGYRAVTIRVDDRTSVEGFVQPGAHVDVVWVSTIRGQPGINTIVENAKILSAQGQTETSSDKSGAPIPRTVTLLVTVQDSQKIQLASTTGQLSLSLRGSHDSGKGSAGGPITIGDITGRAPSQPAPRDNIKGTVTIGGERYLLIDGKLVPTTGQ